MKRYTFWSVMVICAAMAVPVLRADVKTRERATARFEGLMGSFLNRMAGGSDGTTTTVSVKGDRMARMGDNSGQIIDLSEQKIYSVDLRRKEYTVMTFAEMRKQLEDAKAKMAEQQAQLDPQARQQAAAAARELDYDVSVRETGQRKTIAGHEAREVVLAIAMRERDKTLEESGGLVMTSTLWLAPRIPALDEVLDFHTQFYKAVLGGMFSGTDPQQMNALSMLLPGIGSLAEKMGAERAKLDGTPLSTTTVFETVKSAEAMKAAPQPATGGGLGGMLARRLARGQTQQRTTQMTSTSETLSIAAIVADEDVAIPATFKLRQ